MQRTTEHIDLSRNHLGEVYLVEWYEGAPNALGQTVESYAFFAGPLTPPILEVSGKIPEGPVAEAYIMDHLPESILAKCRSQHSYLSSLAWTTVRSLISSPSARGAREDEDA